MHRVGTGGISGAGLTQFSENGAANLAAAVPTTGVPAAGADEMSAFAGHARQYQAPGAQAEAFHQQFVQLLTSGAGSYAVTRTLSGRPLTGNGANGRTPGQAGREMNGSP